MGKRLPHDEGTHPGAPAHQHGGLPTEEKRKLLAGNAAALYDFDLAAMDRAAAKVGPLVSELDAPLESMPEHPNMGLAGAGARSQRDETM